MQSIFGWMFIKRRFLLRLRNIGALHLEWSFEQLKSIGSVNNLLKCKVRTVDSGSKQG
jgi:hypothetical protein